MNEQQIKLFGSKTTDHWQTPADIKQMLGVEYYFDPCPRNPTQDGLLIDWKEKTFVNPPYSQVKKWFKKAHEQLIKGNCKEIVFLVFSNTDTDWFHTYVYDNYAYCDVDIRFIRGRIKFIPDSGKFAPAMRPSMAVIFTGVA